MLIYFHINSAFSLPDFMTDGASLWDTIRLLHLPLLFPCFSVPFVDKMAWTLFLIILRGSYLWLRPGCPYGRPSTSAPSLGGGIRSALLTPRANIVVLAM
uniref:Uncharacterized protein n=2 Tax=Candidatus Kentrum sp. FM TaxID=2126340 RepID=A0A450W611_9GAMM|nr:MAG: hypothetical protein BECKFM1743A_GA0114220_102643 [Candidatus Kentron sp. FM]VFK12500.1 MAG: hypothetical protein BECKFM1743B_GA0114221_102463 [Candidatus Kentron sp. FM]